MDVVSRVTSSRKGKLFSSSILGGCKGGRFRGKALGTERKSYFGKRK